MIDVIVNKYSLSIDDGVKHNNVNDTVHEVEE